MKMPEYRSYVVTGGAQGIGRAIASRLTLEGYVIVIDVADDLGWAHERVRLVSGNAGDPQVAAEAAALAERLGVSTTALFAALRDNPLASPYALNKLCRMVEEDYHADFSLDWARKDLDLAASAGGAGVAPVAGTIAERWRGLVDAGSSGLDVSAARQGLGDFSHPPLHAM